MMISETWSVHRISPLPENKIRGFFIITEPIIKATCEALTDMALQGIRDGGHEALVFWAGLQANEKTVFTTVLRPSTENFNQKVTVSEKEVGRSSKLARSYGLSLLGQVHSHPGFDARHSEGDDHMITMPYENMLSIVVPNFGIGFKDIFGAKIHQFQNGRWVLCSLSSIKNNISIVPIMAQRKNE